MTLDAQSFNYVRELVHRGAAIVLTPDKEYLVEARLLPLARQAGLASVTEFVEQLRRAPVREGLQRVVEALTTNETSWFRDHQPFDALRQTVLPQLLQARGTERRVSIWSAASSSGQEPYSIAMICADLPFPPGWSYSIHATDISEEMLNRGRAGRYSQLEVNRGLPATSLVRHFQRTGPDWQVSESLRSAVTWQRLNLAAAFPVLPRFDVVFLRNVLIYFDTATKQSILRRVRSVIRPDGYLVLGGAETTIGIDEGWERETVGRASLLRPGTDSSRQGTLVGTMPSATEGEV
jgi:chemotaxis protein methyltransferase CheR